MSHSIYLRIDIGTFEFLSGNWISLSIRETEPWAEQDSFRHEFAFGVISMSSFDTESVANPCEIGFHIREVPIVRQSLLALQ